MGLELAWSLGGRWAVLEVNKGSKPPTAHNCVHHLTEYSHSLAIGFIRCHPQR